MESITKMKVTVGPMDQAKQQLNNVSGLSRPEGALYWLTTLAIRMLIAPASVGIGVAIGSSAHRFQRVTAIGITLSIDLFFLSQQAKYLAVLHS
jgi:hypothetical protein